MPITNTTSNYTFNYSSVRRDGCSYTTSTIPASAFTATTSNGFDSTVYRLSKEELDNLDVISKLITGVWPETVNARGVVEEKREKPRFDQIWESDGDGNDEMDEYLNGLEAGEAVEDRK